MIKLAYPVEAPDCDTPLMAMRGSFEGNISALKGLGYEAVELLVRDPEALDNTDYFDILTRYGMKVAALSTAPIGKQDSVTLLDPETTDEAYCRLSDMILLAEKLGQCPISIGKFRGNCAGRDLSVLAQQLCSLDSIAAEKGVLLTLEPQNKTNIDNLHTIAETEAWISSIGVTHIGLHLDTYHMDIEEIDTPDAIRASKLPVGFIHIADRERKVPGQGGIEWIPLFKALAEKQYNGWFSPEIKQLPESVEAARQCMSWANTLGDVI